MNPRSPYFTVFALLTAATAVVFLAISIDGHIYAPGAAKLSGHLGIRTSIGEDFPQIYSHDLSAERIVRKLYSIGAFALVAFFASPLFPRNVRIRAGALLVTGFSLAIEIAQRLISHVSHESNFSSAFDLACGAVGGALGAIAWNVVYDAFRRGSRDAS